MTAAFASIDRQIYYFWGRTIFSRLNHKSSLDLGTKSLNVPFYMTNTLQQHQN